jgi:hypothetical protein
MEAAETIDPRSFARPAVTQDRYAAAMNAIFSSHGLPLALPRATNFRRGKHFT